MLFRAQGEPVPDSPHFFSLVVRVSQDASWYTLAICLILHVFWFKATLLRSLSVWERVPGRGIYWLPCTQLGDGATGFLTVIPGAVHAPAVAAMRIVWVVVQVLVITFFLALFAEEGFLRGWLLGILAKEGQVSRESCP